MKNLLLAFLILISATAYSQITVSSNPALIDPSNTSVNLVTLTKGTLSERLPSIIPLLIKIPSTNAGTVKFNMYSSTMTNADAEAAGTNDKYIWITIRDQQFWIQFSNASDTVTIYW